MNSCLHTFPYFCPNQIVEIDKNTIQNEHNMQPITYKIGS